MGIVFIILHATSLSIAYQRMNYNDTYQTARMHRLVDIFAVHMQQNRPGFLALRHTYLKG